MTCCKIVAIQKMVPCRFAICSSPACSEKTDNTSLTTDTFRSVQYYLFVFLITGNVLIGISGGVGFPKLTDSLLLLSMLLSIS